jgi:hypothetical protein
MTFTTACSLGTCTLQWLAIDHTCDQHNRPTNACWLPCCCCWSADFAALASNGPQLTFGAGASLVLAGNDRLEELHLTGHVMHGFSNVSLWPASLNTMPNLRVLHLSGPSAPGAGLPDLTGSMAQLQSLWLLNMSNVEGEHRTGLCDLALCICCGASQHLSRVPNIHSMQATAHVYIKAAMPCQPRHTHQCSVHLGTMRT